MRQLGDKSASRAGTANGGGDSMLRTILSVLFIVCLGTGVASARATKVIDLTDPEVRSRQVQRLAERSRQRKAAAVAAARRQGRPVRESIRGKTLELMAIKDGRVYAYTTCNEDAAISIAADMVRNTPPYDANGVGLVVGIWDAGSARTTHQEFVGRVMVMDGAGANDHSTHVAGTIAASGVRPSAQGMTPNTLIDAYEWNDDIAEVTSRAMAYPNEPNKIQVSNHSYSYICGWEDSYSPPRWYGTWPGRECDYFGSYDSETAQWDQIAYDAPYYLLVKGAGNDRNDEAPLEGEWFEYLKYPPGVWRKKQYDPATDPCDDGWDNGGFDTIPSDAVGKNILTVGAVEDAVTLGARDVNQATMTYFSSWGPTDDGRIKPDVVTNGWGVYSPTAGSDTDYSTYSGTSMATPGAAGAAMLLVDYYDRLWPGEAMRGSTLKALLIHTTDDLGQPGPDYKFGWGLINTKQAARVIADHNNYPDANKITEAVLDDVNNLHTYVFECDATGPIRATLCWTDPPAAGLTGLDNPSPRLINDLDLRLTDPNGSVYYPYVLDPNNPAAAAAAADNVLDNVEQVNIAAPNMPGTYTAAVSFKGTLVNGEQYYSLILSVEHVDQTAPEDFNSDGVIDINDVDVFADSWLTNDPNVDIVPDGGDGVVNFLDFAGFAQSWP